MKKYIAAVCIAAAILSSCGKGSTPVAEKGDTVSVAYVGKFEDGTIFDQSVVDKPLEFALGSGSVIRGFNDGVLGMKEGETKTITIEPADAYGEEKIETEIPKEALSDVLVEKVPRNIYDDTITKTYPRAEFESKIVEIVPIETAADAEGLVVGQPIGTQGGLEFVVTAIGETSITIEAENVKSPFYGKELVVGLEGELRGNTFTITDLTEDKITFEIDNKTTNPFYGQELVAGLEGEIQEGVIVKILSVGEDTVEVEFPNHNNPFYGQELEEGLEVNGYEVVDIKDEVVVVEVTNPHNLAGKTLIFDVTLEEVKKAQ